MPKSKTKVASATAPLSPSVAWTSRPSLKNKKSKAKRMSFTSRKPQTTKNDDSKFLESNKYLNVSLNRASGRWQAWTGAWTKYMATTWVGRGAYVGEYTTEYLAARGQDRSLLKHRAVGTKVPIKLNFDEADYVSDEKLRNALTIEEFLDLLKRESRPCYKRVEPTKCMQTFVAAEVKEGNLSIKSKGKSKYKVMSLRDYLKEVFMKRPDVVADTPAEMLKKQKAVNQAVDDLLRYDYPNADEMDVADPFPALKKEQMDNDTDLEGVDLEDPIQTEFDISKLLELAYLALTHPDLKPYEV